jgi:hypothetical protein
VVPLASGLGWEKVGPCERYSIKLTGRLDQHWNCSYRRVVASSPSLDRFQLDVAAASISFACPATDGPVEVMGFLKLLEVFLERVNREASLIADARSSSLPTSSSERPHDHHPLAGKSPVDRDRRHGQTKFFLIEKRRGRTYMYRRLALFALLVIAFFAAL